VVAAAPVEVAYDALVATGIDVLVAVPDSLLSPLLDCAAQRDRIQYIQVNDEATAVGVAAGVGLAGARALILMENSGLRRACETLYRFVLSHRLHVAFLISHRGSFGEENWWGIAHSETMTAHLDMLRTPTTHVESVAQLSTALDGAFAMLGTGQCSVCIVAERPFLRELREVG
jgi:sulfopyruvate decarboxylase subunit alpha